MFKVVRNEVEAHEEEENGHGEAGENFCALETEWVAN